MQGFLRQCLRSKLWTLGLWMVVPALATLPAWDGASYAQAEPSGEVAEASDDAPAKVDPKAVKIAEATLEAMGGRQAWENTRYLRFEFFGFRLHHWDRYTGQHRLEGKTRDGNSYVVLHNIQTREGQAWLDGEPLAGEDLEQWLERAYGAWINDAYWLIMPYKLQDPGVALYYEGEETLDGKVYDKLLLKFNRVGLTPGDRYWAWINRETGLMDRWGYHLQGWEADREITQWKWLDWERHGQILLAPRRVQVGDDREAMLGKLAVFDSLPETVFTAPEAVVLD